MRPSLRRICAVSVMLLAATSGAVGQAGLELARTHRFAANPAGSPFQSVLSGEAVHPSLTRLVRLDLEDVPLELALHAIAEQAGLRLGYSREILPADRRVTLRRAELTAERALTRVLAGTGLDVVASAAGHLALIPRPAAPEAGREERIGTVTGRVTDAATGAALSGATVRLSESGRGALTGSDGRYRLEDVPDGSHSLVASLIGYSPATREVSVESGGMAVADFALSISALPLDQVVVTGTVTPTEVREIPTPITVITAEEIEQRNVQRVDELFRGAVPGVVAPDQGTSPESAIQIRGATVMVGAVGVKTFIDGIEVASPTHIVHLDPNTIERIEIIRGPQASTIYGSGAIDGVIQIFTKKGQQGMSRPVLSGHASVGGAERTYASGFAPRQDYALQVAGGGELLSYTVGGSYRRTGDWMPEFAWEAFNLNARARFTQGPLTVDLTARNGMSDGRTAFNAALRDAGYAPWSRPVRERRELAQQTFGGTVTYEVTPGWRHQISAGFDGSKMGLFKLEPGRTTPADTMLRAHSATYGMTTTAYSTTLDVPLSRSTEATVTAGIDHYEADSWIVTAPAASRTAGTIDGPSSVSRIPSDNTGVFTQIRLAVVDALFLTGGVRAERNSNFGEEVGTAVAPRAGVAYETAFGAVRAKLRGSYGEAIRPPNLRHQQETLSAQTHHLPNPDLRPERQRGWDAGVDLYAGDRFGFSVTRYDQTAADLIDIVIIDASSAPIEQQSQNVGSVKNTGWEIEGRLRLAAPLLLTGTYSRMTSTVEELSPTYQGDLEIGDQLRGVPAHTAGAALSYSNPVADLRLEMSHFGRFTQLDYFGLYGWIYGGEPFRGTIREYYIEYPGFTKFSASASRDVADRWQAFLRIDNLTDDQTFESNNVSPPQRRTATIGFRFSQ
jgi:outer membrane receptor protein involved in Fe transport